VRKIKKVAMHVTDAMNVMADAMTAVNAGRWQVSGVQEWRDLIQSETDLAWKAGRGEARLLTGISSASRHDDWKEMARQITAVMNQRAEFSSWRSSLAAANARASAAKIRIMRDGGAEESESFHAYTPAHWDDYEDMRTLRELRADYASWSRKAERYGDWAGAALTAAEHGRYLASQSNRIHEPVGQAMARSGRRWMARDLGFLTRQGVL